MQGEQVGQSVSADTDVGFPSRGEIEAIRIQHKALRG
jgi:hypothetical protein